MEHVADGRHGAPIGGAEQPQVLSQSDLAHFHEHGFVVARNIISSEQVRVHCDGGRQHAPTQQLQYY